VREGIRGSEGSAHHPSTPMDTSPPAWGWEKPSKPAEPSLRNWPIRGPPAEGLGECPTTEEHPRQDMGGIKPHTSRETAGTGCTHTVAPEGAGRGRPCQRASCASRRDLQQIAM
jgi:hypothetical protein